MTYLKAVDATLQDSEAPLYIVKCSNIIAETTLTVTTAKDDYIISVTSATDFVVGQYLTLYSIASNRVYFSNILAINTLDITLDRPLDFEFNSADSVISVGNTNMNVNGSVTPQIFGVRNPVVGGDIPLAIDITRLMFNCLTSTTPILTDFGDITGGLLRGIVIRKIDGEYHNILNAKSNSELKNMMYDFEIETAAAAAQDGFNGRITFAGQNKMGVVIRLQEGEDLQIIIQDDLTSLDNFEIIAEGSEVVD